MNVLIRAASLLSVLALAACATAPALTPMSMNSTPVATAVPEPAQATASAPVITDLNGYVDPSVLPKLSGKSKAEASAAQFNALQFGRVGAPRNWVGDNGTTGAVTVGPFVRVNLVDCRDFLHVITVDGLSFTKKGTACRESDGRWTVSGTANG